MPDAKIKYKEDASNGVLCNDTLGMRGRRAYIDKADSIGGVEPGSTLDKGHYSKKEDKKNYWSVIFMRNSKRNFKTLS